MDWLKLFILLVAVATIHVTAEGPKKKIRIHLPQKVKHIHHHKKIYITNHPASSQYAPAYMPSAEGAVAVPTNMGLPAVASIVPFNSVELYEESQPRLPGVAPAASKLLPLYRARGYYGPTPSEWEDQEYDLAPPPEPSDHTYLPTAFSAPSATGPAYAPKRVKVIKVNEQPRKKHARKVKPKRVNLIRGRPQPEEELPVSNFHEQFYSDLDGTGTIRKVKKPQRVEKIIDGDTEHIHTYSEEHIHKLVYDDSSKLGVLGVDSITSMSRHPLVPLKNSQALLAVSDPLIGYTNVGSLGTPVHQEYSEYNPRDITHDHIFHDHGEIPPDADVTKDTSLPNLTFPPRLSYNSHGVRIGLKAPKRKYAPKYKKPSKPTYLSDLSYYENIYAPYNKLRNVNRPTIPTSQYESASEPSLEDYRPIPAFRFKEKEKIKTRDIPALYFDNGKQLSNYRLQQASVPAPFSVSSTVVHDYKPKRYAANHAPAGYAKFKDPLLNFKDSYSNNYEYDTYASSSNLYTSEDKQESPNLGYQNVKGRKKSISTQNISFGGLDHQTTVDHLKDSDISAIDSDASPTALGQLSNLDQTKSADSVSSTAYTIRESSPVHPYYTVMAIKALHGDQLPIAEASNNNYRYVEAPAASTTPYPSSVATTTAPPTDYYEIQQNIDPITTEPTEYIPENKPRQKSKDTSIINNNRGTRKRYTVLEVQSPDDKSSERAAPHTLMRFSHKQGRASDTGSLKYGDRI